MAAAEKKELELLLAARVPSKGSVVRGPHGGAGKDDPSIAAAIAELRKHTLSMSKEKRKKLAALFADQSFDDVPPLVVSSAGSATVVREDSGTRPLTPRDVEAVREVNEVRKRVLERFDSSGGFDEHFTEYITDVGRKRSLRLQQTGTRPPLQGGSESTGVSEQEEVNELVSYGSSSGAMLGRIDSEEDLDAALRDSSSSPSTTAGVAREATSSCVRLRPLLRTSTSRRVLPESAGDDSSDNLSFYEESDNDCVPAKETEVSYSLKEEQKNHSRDGVTPTESESRGGDGERLKCSAVKPRLLSKSRGTKLRLPSLQESVSRTTPQETGDTSEEWEFRDEEEGEEPLLELEDEEKAREEFAFTKGKEELAVSPALVAQTILQCIDDASDYEFEEYDLDEEYSFSEIESDATLGSETEGGTAGSLHRGTGGLLFDDWSSIG